MSKLFKKDEKTIADEEWLSTLKENGIELTQSDIQKIKENDRETLYNIGLDYHNKKNDNTKAFAWFYKAALENYGPAQNQVGWFYRNGLGVPQDHKLAMEWFKKASSNGNSDAKESISWLYRHVVSVSQDYKLAMEWYQKAASNGNANAQNNIGWLYRNGCGVPQNYKLAMEWYQKAAKNGNGTAMNNIGVLYENGYGVTKNIPIAIDWYKKAADKNIEEAKEALKRLNAQESDDTEKEEDTNIESKNHDSTIHLNGNGQIQPSSSTSDNDEYINKLIDDKIKGLREDFQLKLGLIENEKSQKDEENRQLKERLAKLEAQLGENTNNDLNYDSPDSESGSDSNYDTGIDDSNDDNNDINYDSESSDGEKGHHRRNSVDQKTSIYVSDETYADPNYDSSDNEDRVNDIYFD